LFTSATVLNHLPQNSRIVAKIPGNSRK